MPFGIDLRVGYFFRTKFNTVILVVVKCNQQDINCQTGATCGEFSAGALTIPPHFRRDQD